MEFADGSLPTPLYSLITLIDIDSQLSLNSSLKEAESYDLVFVFHTGNDEIVTYKGEFWVQKDLHGKLISIIVNKLKMAGLTVILYYTKNRGASENRLMIEADRVDYDLLLDPEETLQYGLARNVRIAMAVTDISNPLNYSITPQSFYNLYAKFARKNPAFPGREKLYVVYDNQGSKHARSVFRTVDRIKLLLSIIEARVNVGGAGLSLDRELASQIPLCTMYPLNETEKLDDLWVKLTTWESLWDIPLEDIRSYYGEEVAYYFAFLNFYTRWLSIPAITGFVIYLTTTLSSNDSGLLFFGVFVSIWVTFFLFSWKQRQLEYRMLWGMTNFAVTEQPRPDFSGIWRRSPIDGKLEISTNYMSAIFRLSVSYSVLLIMICIVVGAMISIFLSRSFFLRVAPDYAANIINILLALNTQFFNIVFLFVAKKLTDFENHKTQTGYRNNFIAKRFVIKFINCISFIFYALIFLLAYNALIYILLFKKDQEGCLNNDCLGELRSQLFTSFVANIVLGNTLEVLIPYITAKDRRTFNPDKTQPEAEWELSQYVDTMDDYDDISVSWGFTILTAVVLPLLFMMSFVSMFIELRVAAWKIIRLSRRAIPKSAEDIGSWLVVIDIVSWIAIISNIYICVFFTTELNGVPDSFKVATFFLILNGVITVKSIFFFLPAMKPDIAEHIQRSRYLKTVMIDGAKEEEELDYNAASEVADTKSLLEADIDMPHVFEEIPPNILQ